MVLIEKAFRKEVRKEVVHMLSSPDAPLALLKCSNSFYEDSAPCPMAVR